MRYKAKPSTVRSTCIWIRIVHTNPHPLHKLFHLVEYDMEEGRKFWLYSIAILVVAAWLLLNLSTLHSFPYPSCDEAFFSEAAHNLLESGIVAHRSHLDYGLLDQTIVALGRIVIASIAASQSIFGVSLWSSRLPALLMGFLTSYLVYAAGKTLFTKTTGIYAGVLFALSWHTVYHSHFARPEIWLAGFATLTLLLAWRFNQKPNLQNGLLAGLVAALNVDIHLSGLSFSVAATLMILAQCFKNRQVKLVLYYMLGGVIGLLYWLAAHYLADPHTFTYQLFELYADQTVAGGSFWQRFADLGGLYWSEYVLRNNYLEAVPSTLLFAGLAYSIQDRRQPSRFLLSYFVISSLVFAAMTPVKRWYHMMLWVPMLTIMGAEFVNQLADWLEKQVKATYIQNKIHWILPLPMIIILLAGNVYLFIKFSNDDFGRYAERIIQATGDEGSILAPHQLWFYDPRDDFVASTAAIFLLAEEQKTEMTESDAERLYRDADPDYVVLTPAWLCLDNEWAGFEVVEQTIQANCTVIRDAGYFEDTVQPNTVLYECP
jgi:4-amino-4-deoxy-L-arabinose transferase-like glycosyltransferase